MSYIPSPEIVFLPEDGGFYEITVGDQRGWVTSNHLVGTKTTQLQAAWLAAHPDREQQE